MRCYFYNFSFIDKVEFDNCSWWLQIKNIFSPAKLLKFHHRGIKILISGFNMYNLIVENVS